VSHQPHPQQPGWAVPQPPRPPKKTHPAAIAGIGCLGIIAMVTIGTVLTSLTGSDSSDKTGSGAATKSSAPKAKDTPAKADDKPSASAQNGKTPGLDKRQITELTVNLVWDGYTDTQKDTLCLGVEAYGEDWLADQLNSDSLDHDYAAELVSDKCETR